MKLFNRNMRFYIWGLAAMLFSSASIAAIEKTDLQALELDIWSVRSGYYLYSVMSGDSIYDKALQKKITDAKSSYARLVQQAEGEDDAKFLQDIGARWPQFVRLANQNSIAKKGYTDSYLAIELNNQAADIISLLEQYEAKGNASDLLVLAIKSQRMTSEYLSLAAAPDGGMSTAEGNIRIDFDQAVPEFDKLLAAAQKKYANNDAVTRSLEQVARKWRFIRESMVKFYEDSVPFLVNRYSEQIVELIDQVTE